MSFSGSRSAGQRTTASRPSAAARAATAFARLPVEEHESVVRPSSSAFAAATATTRSLNECVGFAVSSLSQSSRTPSADSRRGARMSGVRPGGRRCSAGGATGSRSAYRQIERGPASIDAWVTVRRCSSRSYTGSSGPKHLEQTPIGSRVYCVSQTRHLRAVAGTTRSPFVLRSTSSERTVRSAGLGTTSLGTGCRGVTGPVPSASLDAERDAARFRQPSLPRAVEQETDPLRGLSLFCGRSEPPKSTDFG